ncbi:putative peroxidase [Helianthus annuus]|nr:putative peroxidase [Helianthus annuus]
MDWELLTSLRRTCPQNAAVDRAINLDQNPFSSSVVDKSFYNQIMLRRGVFQIDQELAIDSLTKPTVAAIASSSDFTTKFGQAMVKLGAIQVLTGTEGEIGGHAERSTDQHGLLYLIDIKYHVFICKIMSVISYLIS